MSAALAAPLPAGCAGALELSAPLTVGDAWAWLAAGALLNAVVLGALLLAWERLTRARRERAALRRELRYLRLWSDPPGILRKVGLLRDLNALGAVPESLEECLLAGADLKGVRLAGCRLRGARLAGADLQGAELSGADLFGADLGEANLAMSALRGADLRGANLEGASLVKAELEHANLRRANLVNADLHGARLDGVLLERARFALRQEGLFQQTVHPSVEDWIRERLDNQGCYRTPGSDEDDAGRLPDAV